MHAVLWFHEDKRRVAEKVNSNYGDDGAVPHDSSNSEIQPAVKSSQTSLCVARWFAFRWIVVVLACVDSLYGIRSRQ